MTLEFIDESVEGDSKFAVILVKSFYRAFNVLDPSGSVKGAGGHEARVGIKSDSTDFTLVTNKFGDALTRGHVPDISGAVKGAGDYLIAEGVVESEGLDNVVVSRKGVELLSVVSVVEPAGSILGSGDEAGAVFVEADVGEGQVVGLDYLILLVGVVRSVFLFLDELIDECLEGVAAFLSDDFLLLQDGIHEKVDVGLSGQV